MSAATKTVMALALVLSGCGQSEAPAAAEGRPVEISPPQVIRRAQPAKHTVAESSASHASRLRTLFPDGLPIHGDTYALDALPCLPEDIAVFTVSVSHTYKMTETLTIEGKVRLGQVGPEQFRVLGGDDGKGYLLHLQAFLVSPEGGVVWSQQGWPRGNAWIKESGGEADFTLMNAYRGPTDGHTVLLVAAGEPLLSAYDETRVVLGIAELDAAKEVAMSWAKALRQPTDRANEGVDLLEYRIAGRQDVSYLGTPRMVYRVMIETSQLPAEDQMRELAKSLWQDGNKHWAEFTVFLYLPGMKTNSTAYGIGEFRPSGLQEFQVQEYALFGTSWWKK